MECLHICLNCHLVDIVSSYSCVFESCPKASFRREFQLFYYFRREKLPNHLKSFQFPNIDMSSAVTDDSKCSAVWGEAAGDEFTGKFDWKMFDSLISMQWRVKHSKLLLEDSQELAICTVFNILNCIFVLFKFLADTRSSQYRKS